jgi:hypothetical protein
MKNDIIFKDFIDFVPSPKQINMICIYDRPNDYPERFVGRIIFINHGVVIMSNAVILADTLEELKTKIPSSMVYLDRQENDDPKIVGVYL